MIPIFQVLDKQGWVKGDVARLDIYAGGPYSGSSIGIFGLPSSEIIKKDELLSSVVKTAGYILKPKIASAVLNTTQEPGLSPKLTISLHNPLSQNVKGKIVIDIGDGALTTEQDVVLAKQQLTSVAVKLPVVPKDFSFKRFDWKVRFLSDKGNDELTDSVDVERSVLFAFKHLIETQKLYPDGRYSNHYFGDAYGVRAMFAYGHYLKKNPARLSANKDIWQTISPKDIEESAFRFCDMLVKRQNSNGSIPMGYSEHTGGYNIADGGQIAISLAQLSQYVNDLQKKEAYLALCRRFADWSETFYIDSTLSAKLMAMPGTKASEAKVGLYGLGMSGKNRRQTGPSWVLSDILAVQLYLAYADSSLKTKEYRRIADRNSDFYVNSMYNAAGYYQSEALFWTWHLAADQGLKQKIRENLDNTFLPPLYKGKVNDMYDLGSRSTLRALSMLYYQRFIKDEPNLRAVLLKYIWSFGSGSSASSMERLSKTFGKAVHGESLAASKYAALSAIWAMELLDPGSSLSGHANQNDLKLGSK